MTVARYLQAPTFPERKGHTNPGKSVLTPYKERLLKRWNAGCREAIQLFRDLQRHGYTGSYPTVARYAQRLRQAQGLQPREQRLGQTLPRVVESQHRPLTTRRTTRLVLKRPLQRTDEDAQLIAHLQVQHHDLAVAIDLAQDFCTLLRARQADRFDDWLARALASGVAALRRFATGLQRGLRGRESWLQAALEQRPRGRPHQPPEDAEAADVRARQARPPEPTLPACGVTPLGGSTPRANGGEIEGRDRSRAEGQRPGVRPSPAGE